MTRYLVTHAASMERTTSETVVSSSAALFCTAAQSSSSIRMARSGVGMSAQVSGISEESGQFVLVGDDLGVRGHRFAVGRAVEEYRAAELRQGAGASVGCKCGQSFADAPADAGLVVARACGVRHALNPNQSVYTAQVGWT